MKYMTSLYQTMSEYADNIAIVDEKTPHVRVLIESPSENIGEITGHVSLTVIYGSTLAAIYSTMDRAPGLVEECEEQPQKRLLDSGVDITQLSNDVLIKRTRLNFGWI
ncbi:hypothetical protein DPEC_G00067660 [Dallia pectoralis]|uniref:Uncharacterized protein n=1 Tax=Dallia pectoralis TaxID=75939 RepID=A0ACC2H1C9_DALPE|nr:hypothetical protein DPEC_G00067660 [Dallia pectoralis]